LAKPSRDCSSGTFQTFFITATSSAGQALLQSERSASLFRATLFAYRDAGRFQVHEFVVMPNHIHLLITLQRDTTLERAMQLIKGGFSYRVKKDLGISSEIWQRGYVDHRIRDANDFAQHRAYIPANPVRARLPEAAEAYPYCSAFPGFSLDAAPQGLKHRAACPYGTTEVVLFPLTGRVFAHLNRTIYVIRG